MAFLVDLHLHTTASDGRLEPKDLIRLLIRQGLRLVAITDHDSLEGIDEARLEASKHPQLNLIPGIEITASTSDGEAHILGYGMDTSDKGLQDILLGFRNDREVRAREMVDKLNFIGIGIAWSRVAELAEGAAVTRPHVALAMVEAGYVTSIGDAFSKYIGNSGPAYVSREHLGIQDAIKLITTFGGLPVLAHPARYVKNLEDKLPDLTKSGLIGMEVFYKDYTDAEVKYLLDLSKEYHLVAAGGSDYHANGTPDEVLPGTVGPAMGDILDMMKPFLDTHLRKQLND